MAIEGPLRELSIHDVFQLLDLSRKTGRLRVSSALRDNEGTVFFRGGRVVGASIRSNPHPLGTLLLRAGRITEADLARARAAQQAGASRRLGELLVDAGALSARELRRHVMHQIEVVVFELLSWQEGFFSFIESDESEVTGDDTIEVPTESLLMEGARRLDEWTQISETIPHLGVVPRLADLPDDGPAPRLDLRPNEWEVLAAMDGERDLRAIATALNRSDFEVGRIAFGLVTTGIIVCGEPAALTPPTPVRRQVTDCLADAREAMALDQWDAAASHAATAVAMAPDDAEARWTLSRILSRLGREAESMEQLERALVLHPDHPAGLMDMARACARRGELDAAVARWERLVASAPGTPLAAQAAEAIVHARQLVTVLAGQHA